MKFVVREGYTLFLRNHTYTGGSVVDAEEEDIKGQEWKVEVSREKKPRNKREESGTPPLPLDFKGITSPPVDKMLKGEDSKTKGGGAATK